MRATAFAAALILTASVGCNSSEFSGSGGGKAPSTTKTEKKKSDDDALPVTKTKTDTAYETGTQPAEATQTVASDAPPSAVTAGSFKAWANPASPREDEDYTIFIEVTLPANVSPQSYTKEDLSGNLRGTDGYQQAIERSFAPIPGPLPIIPPFDPRGIFQVSGKLARISFVVPGAASHVSDTITIHSNALNESQTVALVFQ